MTSVSACTAPLAARSSPAARLSALITSMARSTSAAGGLLRLDGGRRDPAPERLREEEHVARARAHVPEDAVGVDDAGDRHAVLGLGVVDGVAPEDGRAGEPRRLGAAAQDLSEQLHRELRDRPADEVQREERPRAHRPHVGERVRRGDAAEPVRVVHDGREEVDRLDDRLGVREPVDGGVVARLGPDERARVIDPGHVAQHLRQIRRADLAGSTRAVAEAREADLLLGLHGLPHTRAHARGQRGERYRACGGRPRSLRVRRTKQYASSLDYGPASRDLRSGWAGLLKVPASAPVSFASQE